MADLAQDIGRLEGRMDGVDKRLEQMEAQIEHLTKLVTELRDGQEQFKGGYTLLATVVAVAGSLGAAVSWIVQHITYH